MAEKVCDGPAECLHRTHYAPVIVNGIMTGYVSVCKVCGKPGIDLCVECRAMESLKNVVMDDKWEQNWQNWIANI
jgi:hypothetical protein